MIWRALAHSDLDQTCRPRSKEPFVHNCAATGTCATVLLSVKPFGEWRRDAAQQKGQPVPNR